jgi:hypothetical protein
VAVHGDHGEDRGDLHAGLELGEVAGGDDHAGLRGAHPQDRDGQLARDDHHRHPGGEPVQRDQRDQRGDDQQLVGERVHQLAKGRDRVARARQVAVDEVGRRGQREDDRREDVAVVGVPEQRDDDHGHK